jgi:hypothetical protein
MSDRKRLGTQQVREQLVAAFASDSFARNPLDTVMAIVAPAIAHARHLNAQDRVRLFRQLELVEGVLRELVTLKDGPRDADYERRKPLAWQHARDLLDGGGESDRLHKER